MNTHDRPAVALLAIPVLVTLLASLAGCQSGTYEPVYDLRVTEAVVEDGVPEEGPGTHEIAIRATWTADSGGFVGSFANPADTTAAIHWDEATIAIDGGETQPLLSAAPHPNPDLPQPPTIIPRRGTMMVGMLSAGHAEWEWFTNRAMGGAWHPTRALFGIAFDAEQSESDRRDLARTAVGKKIMIELPVRTGSRKLTHIYDIRVVEADIRATHN